MKKILTLISTIILIMAMSTMLIACEKEASIEIDQEMSTWLKNISDEALITKIALPGTHDSGTIGMMAQAETQGASIGDQLKMGARYLDIRVNGGKEGGVIFHSVVDGVAFPPIMDDIKAFIETNKSEVLVLDFQHFKNGGEKVVADAIIASGLIDYVVHNTSGKSDIDHINSLTLKDVRGKVLIFFGNDKAKDFDTDYIFARNNDDCTLDGTALDSLYIGKMQKKNSETFIKETLPKYVEHINDKHSGIMVLQGQLTAPNLLVNLSSLEKGHSDNMNKYVRAIKDDETFLSNVNVIMRDYIDRDKEKTQSILSLNYYKGIVGDNMIEKYKTLSNIE